ncbi:hypothetical protein HK097_002845 [Rhizophlyctis rosea]|uniref:Uncharacterized protein n=1 Tax=Rhizophlyctis rosea TaxID=64517 RepID=A0AAD5X6F3_9FUNG|nr:hypothetical protein HK097_002845 [Rhizophlyctis rosea]
MSEATSPAAPSLISVTFTLPTIKSLLDHLYTNTLIPHLLNNLPDRLDLIRAANYHQLPGLHRLVANQILQHD